MSSCGAQGEGTSISKRTNLTVHRSGVIFASRPGNKPRSEGYIRTYSQSPSLLAVFCQAQYLTTEINVIRWIEIAKWSRSHSFPSLISGDVLGHLSGMGAQTVIPYIWTTNWHGFHSTDPAYNVAFCRLNLARHSKICVSTDRLQYTRADCSKIPH